MAPIGWNIGSATTFKADVKGYLIAWDPVHQKEVWRANYLGPWNGGILTTAGNLVVQGNAAGFFSAYRADNGEKLWSTAAQSAVMASPATYEIDGEQYIAVLSGWGGAYPLMQGKGSDKSGNTRNVSRVLVFKLGSKAKLPPLPPEPALPPPPQDVADAATVAKGEALFGRFCSVCHGQAAVGGGVVPDLRASQFIAVDAWYSIVLDGALREGGMAPFASALDRKQASAIRDYVIRRANAPDAPNWGKPARQPDLSHGAIIVAQGIAGAPACAQCHAFTGGSDASGAFPRIAGQPAYYLSRQLKDFKSGVRENPIMSPIARALSPEDAADVSAYFAGLDTPFPPLAAADPNLVKKGKEVAEAGVPARGIPACGACHGTGGKGEPPAIAAQGTASGMPACSGCHAFDGGSDGTGAFPRIAGLPASYIEAQLSDFASGVRLNALMSPIAKTLTPDEINKVATYYANVKAPFPPLKSASPSLIKLGEHLATAGDEAKAIPACELCHGPQGNGQLGIAPYLGGQYAHYIAFTLHMWQSGYRKNSPDVMEPFAKKLDDQQIKALAAYFQQIRASAAAQAKK